MINYVLGFCFSEDRSKVALIKKTKPDWQKGKLNGIGGKVDLGELSVDAMIREFSEETGEEIHGWKSFARLIGPDFVVECFVVFTNQVKYCQTTMEEKVFILEVDRLFSAMSQPRCNIIPNLKWLIPMALSKENIIADIHYAE